MNEQCRLITLEQWQEYKKLKELSEQTFITVDGNGNFEEIKGFGSGTIQVLDDLPNTWQELVEWAKPLGYSLETDLLSKRYITNERYAFMESGVCGCLLINDTFARKRTPRQMAMIIKALGD